MCICSRTPPPPPPPLFARAPIRPTSVSRLCRRLVDESSPTIVMTMTTRRIDPFQQPYRAAGTQVTKMRKSAATETFAVAVEVAKATVAVEASMSTVEVEAATVEVATVEEATVAVAMVAAEMIPTTAMTMPSELWGGDDRIPSLNGGASTLLYLSWVNDWKGTEWLR